jgi:hypothetical protein
MTDPNSPSTSYKDSLELVTSKSSNDPEQELTFVNPCYAAPTPFTELQPFSSRQSQSHGKLENNQPEGGHTWDTIHEGDEKGYRDGEIQLDEGGKERVMSKTKMFLTAAGMCLTYFLGVSLPLSRPPYRSIYLII